MIKREHLELLRPDQVQDIYRGALDVLEKTGVKVGLDTVRRKLKESGCPVRDEIVSFPPDLVQSCTQQAPDRFSLYGRNADYVVDIQENQICFQPMIGRLNILDAKSNKKRRTTLKDVADLVKIADSLQHYHLLHSGAIMPHIEGIPDPVAHAQGYLTSVRNSSKVIKATCRGRMRAIDCIRMAAAIAGGEDALKKKPNVYTTYNIISPLEHGKEMLEGLCEYVKYGLPIDITSEPQMGATSPVTLAGTLVQQTAELLSGVVITQILKPGAPVFIGTCGAAMDMQYGTIALGGIEANMLNIAHAQIARFLHIPSRGTGGNSDAKILDFQAGYEKALSLLIDALAGINMIFYPGTIDHAETISLESLLLDHEICSIIFKLLEGITVSKECLATDLIKKVGPSGHYLNAQHTLNHLFREHFKPRYADRKRREDWEESGSKDIVMSARENVEQLLANHKPEVLPADLDADLEKIVAEVEKRELAK